MTRRALSLLEVLLTMGILVLILGVAAGLMHSYLTHKRYRDQQEKALMLLAFGLERMTREVESAERLILTGPSLSFSRINPRTARLPVDLPANVPALWPSDRVADRITVEYALVEQQLRRTVTSPDQSQEIVLIGEEVANLSTRAQGKSVEITLRSTQSSTSLHSQAVMRL